MAAATALLASLVVLGCGDEDSPEEPSQATQPLTRAERELVSRSEEALAAYCARRISPSGELRAPSARQRQRAFATGEGLVALAERKPSAEVATGVDLRLALGDLVENLEAANCDPELIAVLTSALARVPG